MLWGGVSVIMGDDLEMKGVLTRVISSVERGKCDHG